MKKPKRINSKRPSLWKCDTIGAIRAFYPSGHVEMYEPYFGSWFYSCYSDEMPKRAIQDLKETHTFLGYL